MRLRFCMWGILSGFLLSLSLTSARAVFDDRSLEVLGEPIQSRDEKIQELRNQGPEGLFRALDFRRSSLDQQEINSRSCVGLDPLRGKEYWELLDQAIDQIGGQRYASQSELYWYTDWEQAIRASRESNRPILALKMMGRLTDEFSCANSRFFRTTLYLDPKIRETLGRDFVLYWSSVRPVPKVTIDYGDGRTLERTLTGNSIHYVLAPSGLILDGLPGLNGPSTFLEWLEAMKSLAAMPENLTQHVISYHQRKLAVMDVRHLATNSALSNSDDTKSSSSNLQHPTAQMAMARSISKSFIEMPMFASSVGSESFLLTSVNSPRLVELSQESQQMIRRENPNIDESAAERLLKKFCETIAQDELLNEQLHTTIHQWLSTSSPRELDEFNEQVYSQLFLTPSSDRWLGMGPEEFYTGLVNGGLKSAYDQYHYDRR